MSYDIWQDFEKMRQDLTDNTHISRKALEAMLDAHKEVAAERDALAALCQEGAAVLERTANDTLDGRNMAVRLREANTTSLARLKAQWQVEAINRLHDRYMTETGGHGSVSGYVWDELQHIRRQAEGGE